MGQDASPQVSLETPQSEEACKDAEAKGEVSVSDPAKSNF
jgi:hypothetical protein